VFGRTFSGFSAIAVAVESAAEQQVLGFSLSFPLAALAPDQVRAIAARMIDAAKRIGIRTHDRYWMDLAGQPPEAPPASPRSVAGSAAVRQLTERG
jgi:hypothetical protein